jgi:hypothetical protein
MASKTLDTWSSNGVKTSHCGNFYESFLATYWKLVHTFNYSKEEAHYLNNNCFCKWTYYERPHTNDGILDIEGRHPTKWILTKRSGQNIITYFCGTNTSKAKEGHNDDDDDNDTNIFDGEIEAWNVSDYHEPWPQHPSFVISHHPRSRITRASQS